MSDPRSDLIDVLRRIRLLLRDAGREAMNDEIAQVDEFLSDLETGADRRVRSLGVLFYPTCDLQDIAIRCGWGDEYCRLADRAEALVAGLLALPSPRQLPLDLDAIRDLCSAAPTRDLASCSVCSRIPADSSRFEKGGKIVRDTIPGEIQRLADHIAFPPGSDWPRVLRCAECGRYYLVEYESEFLYGGSEDTTTVTRVTAEDLREKNPWRTVPSRAQLRQDGVCWRIVTGP